MLYKHWKKFALALTALFWAGCEDSASSAVCLYGPAPNYSSATENPVSSSSAPSTSSGTEISSSSSEFGVISSSSMEIPVPAYGVFGAMACYEDASSKVTQGQTTKTTYRCDDGVTCQEEATESWKPEFECIEEICPDYGVVSITEKTYTCDDGNTYNYADFISRYSKVDASEGAQGE
ncbi:MAG: hypothetical protein K6E57_08545 [Fibrobacter sp.]|nr:hypothetical protein [Fibrobacter sp.]